MSVNWKSGVFYSEADYLKMNKNQCMWVFVCEREKNVIWKPLQKQREFVNVSMDVKFIE